MKKLFILLLSLFSLPMVYAWGPSEYDMDMAPPSIWQEQVNSWVTLPIYSLDWKSFAYINYENSKASIFLNWINLWTYDDVDSYSLFFNDENKLLAKVKSNNKWTYLIDWKLGVYYDDVNSLNIKYWTWSSKYEHSYIWLNDWKYNLVFNWKIVASDLEYIENYPNTDVNYLNVVYIAKDAKGKFLIVNWLTQAKRYFDLWYSVTSNSWNKFYTLAYTEDWKTIVLENWKKELWKYDYVWNIVFSIDDKKVYYSVLIDSKNYFVLNWTLIKQEYDYIKEYYYSYPDWKFFFQTVSKSWKEYVMVNWKVWKKYDEVGYINISSDWKNYFYFARNKDSWVWVLNWKEVK